MRVKFVVLAVFMGCLALLLGPTRGLTQFPGGRGPGGNPPSKEEMDRRRKQALDRSTPEERAQRDQFRRDLDNRRRQRGLPVPAR